MNEVWAWESRSLMTLDDWKKVERAAHEDLELQVILPIRSWHDYNVSAKAWNRYRNIVVLSWSCVQQGQKIPERLRWVLKCH